MPFILLGNIASSLKFELISRKIKLVFLYAMELDTRELLCHSSKIKAVTFYFAKFYSTKVISCRPRTTTRTLVIFFESR